MTLALLAVAWLLTYLLHSTILLGGAWVLTATGVVRSPVAKDTLWKVCLVGGLLTASVQSVSQDGLFGRRFWLPSAAPAAQAAAPRVTSGASVAGAKVVRGAPARSRASGAAGRRANSASVPEAAATYDPQPTNASFQRPSWPVLLLLVWGAGAGLLVTRLAIRRRLFCRRLGNGGEIEGGALAGILESLCAAAGVRRRVRLSVSADLSGPVAMGTSRICLPERVLTGLTPAEQRAVLAHELGHLVRQDPTWLALAVVVESVCFLQPLNRLARLKMQESAEYLCDDWAVHHTGGSLTLAKCLAEVASWMQATRHAVPVSGMAENRSQFVARVERLLDGAEPRAVRGLRLAVPVAALALSTVAFAAPGVLPPCEQGTGDAVAAAARPAAPAVVWPTGHYDWATIRDGRMLVFRSGFSARITGQGRLGIRRGGKALELMDGQQLTVNGRAVSDDDVAVCESDTVRIVDERGATVWSLEPVALAPGRAGATARAADRDDDDAAAVVTSDDDAMDTVNVDVDDADVADVASEAAEAGIEMGRAIQAEVLPHVAKLQAVSAGLAADLAPRLAELGSRLGADIGSSVAADIGPAIASAFGDGCDRCTRAGVKVRRLHRGIDGRKHLR